ncbi:MAG: hypothetical protein Tsb0013_07670 [Phycisphaerales bacterium]
MFSNEIITMPQVPRLLGNILAHMFNTNIYRLEASPGSRVQTSEPFITVPFRRFFWSERRIKSPATGVVISSRDSRVGEDWCLIAPFRNTPINSSGAALFEDFAKGFWPMKPSVYRYAQPALGFSERELRDALDELLASSSDLRQPTPDDIEAIERLARQPEYDVSRESELRSGLREMAASLRGEQSDLHSAGSYGARDKETDEAIARGLGEYFEEQNVEAAKQLEAAQKRYKELEARLERKIVERVEELKRRDVAVPPRERGESPMTYIGRLP